jgi:hypothetical protein
MRYDNYERGEEILQLLITNPQHFAEHAGKRRFLVDEISKLFNLILESSGVFGTLVRGKFNMLSLCDCFVDPKIFDISKQGDVLALLPFLFG